VNTNLARSAGPGGRSARRPHRPAAVFGLNALSFEVYQVPTWEEHLRQHQGRLTEGDEADEERAQALAEGPPVGDPSAAGRRRLPVIRPFCCPARASSAIIPMLRFCSA
jgi:hypothetical protein